MKHKHLELRWAAVAACSLFSASLYAQPTASKGTAAPVPTPAAKSEASAKAPTNAAPVKAAPVKAAPVKAEVPATPAKAAPAKAAPAKAEVPAPAAKATPAKTVPSKAAPATAKDGTKAEAAAVEEAPATPESAVEGEPSDAPTQEGAASEPLAPAAAEADKAKADEAQSVSAAEKPPVEAKPKGPEAPLYSFIRLYLSVASVWNKDPGYDLFSKDDVGQRIGLQADFDVLDLTDSLTLALEAGIAGESDSDGRTPIGLANEGSLSSTHLFGGVVGRVNVLSFLDLHARATGGASFTELEFQPDTSNLSEDVVSPVVGLGGGFSLFTEPRRLDSQRRRFNSIAFGARFEGGYVMSSKIEMAFADQQVDIPEQRLRVQGATLGSLDRTGAYFDVAAFVNF